MDDETKDILTRLDNIASEEADLQASLMSNRARRSELLGSLEAKIGKKFTRKGVTYTICKRGETYFTKSFGLGVPTFD